MTSNNETVSPPKSLSGQHFKMYSSFKIFQLCNKLLIDWSRGKQLILFPENLHVSRGGVYNDAHMGKV